MKLDDLFDPLDHTAAVEAGYVRVQQHPALRLLIHNYTERAQYERVWTPVTQQCRGLITTDGGTIIARPWPKFFNYGEHADGTLDLVAPVEVTDKMDGSLGIMYPTPDGWAIATRGSFTSDQAVHATQLLRTRYADFEPPTGFTCLFEIVYPANRIVVDYGQLDDLILLGAMHTDDGIAVGPDWVSGWHGPLAETFPARTLADALALPPRPNAEGVVVRYVDTDVMLKIKQDDYIQLHRLITGLNARVVWERIGAGETAADICAQLPDEFHTWVTDLADELDTAADRILVKAMLEHAALVESLGEGFARKDYAMQAQRSELRPWLFMLLDGKNPMPKIWASIKPSGARSLVNYSEDVA